VGNSSYRERFEAELQALGISEAALNPEIIARLKSIPVATFEQLGRYFTPGAVYGTLVRTSPSRGGIDAWTWVENGHSWVEVGEQFRRVFESDATQ
jgi:hypothetical protein